MVAAYETDKLMREESLMKAFDFFDSVYCCFMQDGTGYLDINEMRELLG
jgi:Ca2+-binding EF-hand superfamily protein